MASESKTQGDLDVIEEIEIPATREWLYATLQGFVDDETAIDVTSRMKGDGAEFRVSVAREDIGKVIGKQGRMARCLRTILLARGRKIGVVYTLDLQTPAVEAAPELARAS